MYMCVYICVHLYTLYIYRQCTVHLYTMHSYSIDYVQLYTMYLYRLRVLLPRAQRVDDA